MNQYLLRLTLVVGMKKEKGLEGTRGKKKDDLILFITMIGLVVNRADSLEVHDFGGFSRFAGILLTDSPDTSQNPRCGFGTGSDLQLDMFVYGIIVTASNTPGYEFTNLLVGGATGGIPAVGQAAVQLRAGGSIAPDVLINGGSAYGTWALGPFPTAAAGHLTVKNVIGYDIP